MQHETNRTHIYKTTIQQENREIDLKFETQYEVTDSNSNYIEEQMVITF